MADSFPTTNLPSVYQPPNAEYDLLPSTPAINPTQQVTKQQTTTPQTANNDATQFTKYLNDLQRITAKHHHHENPADPATQISQNSIYTDTSAT